MAEFTSFKDMGDGGGAGGSGSEYTFKSHEEYKFFEKNGANSESADNLLTDYGGTREG